MYIPDIELHECTTLQEATTLMATYAPDARYLAGGTDLLVDLKTSRVYVDHLISITRISALHGVSSTKSGLRIGALATITQLSSSVDVGERFVPILDATREMANQQIRNAATVGGNIVSAVPCADLPPILMTMNASVLLWSPKKERRLPLDSFFKGPRQTVIRNDELLTAVLVRNLPEGFGAAYARFALRDGNAIAVAGVAAGLLLDDNHVVREARIVLGAVAPIPKLVKSAGDLLVGKPPGEEAFHKAAQVAMEAADPISDVRGSADYRREVVKILTRRALARACERACKGVK